MYRYTQIDGFFYTNTKMGKCRPFAFENSLLGEYHAHSRVKCCVFCSGLSEVLEGVCVHCHSGNVKIQGTIRKRIREQAGHHLPVSNLVAYLNSSNQNL